MKLAVEREAAQEQDRKRERGSAQMTYHTRFYIQLNEISSKAQLSKNCAMKKNWKN